MRSDEVEEVVAGLKARDVFAHVHRMGVNKAAIRVALPGGAEAIWDADGAAGLEAQVMRDGVLIDFVPVIPGSADFTVDESIAAIASTEYRNIAQ